MSKAFTRETDDAPESPAWLSLRPVLPSGAKNYMTPDGARQLHEELDSLLKQQPKTISDSASSTDKTVRQSLDHRILKIQHSLETAVVTPAPPPPWEQVRFGATVTVQDERGEQSQYRIVGVDQADVDRGWVTWLSPIARALLNAQLGQKIQFKFPAGEAQLEITHITYP